jgi:hypothetical protein
MSRASWDLVKPDGLNCRVGKKSALGAARGFSSKHPGKWIALGPGGERHVYENGELIGVYGVEMAARLKNLGKLAGKMLSEDLQECDL